MKRKLGCAIAAAALLLTVLLSAGAEAGKPPRQGYDPRGDLVLTDAGIRYRIPEYMTEVTQEDTHGAILREGFRQTGLIAFYSQHIAIPESEADDTLTQAAEELKNMVADDGAACTCEDFSIAGFPGKLLTGRKAGNDGKMSDTAGALAYDSADSTVILVLLVVDDSAQYSYLSDFRSMLRDAEREAAAADHGGVDPALKKSLDALEAFFDEYIEFMTSYAKNPSDLGLMMKYVSILTRYTEAMEQLDALENSSSSTADTAYYLEVYARIMQKLAGAAKQF